MNKTEAAFRLSCRKIFASGQKCYFWTFTFKDVLGDKEAFKRWHRFATNMKLSKSTGHLWSGVRVVEVHPGGHGLHFHCLVTGRLPVRVVRHKAVKAGLGYIMKVKRADEGTIDYLAKYMSKAGRDGLAKGCRKWSCIGGAKGSLVKNLRCESILSENCRRVRQLVGSWSHELFVQVNRLTAKYGHCLDWPTFPELQARAPFVPGDCHVGDVAARATGRDGYPVQFEKLRLFSSEAREWLTYVLPVPSTRRANEPF